MKNIKIPESKSPGYLQSIDINSKELSFKKGNSFSFVAPLYTIVLIFISFLFIKDLFSFIGSPEELLKNLLFVLPLSFASIYFIEILRFSFYKINKTKLIVFMPSKPGSIFFTCFSKDPTSKVQTLIFRLAPFLIIFVILILSYMNLPKFGLLISMLIVVKWVYFYKEISIIQICLNNWKEKLYSYFQDESVIIFYTS